MADYTSVSNELSYIRNYVNSSNFMIVDNAVDQDLQGNGINVIGVALDANQDAMVTLSKLVNNPASKYLQPVRIDDFDVLFLNRMCHSFDFVTPVLSSQAAVYVNMVLPCNGLPNRLCNSYEHCYYNATGVPKCLSSSGCWQMGCTEIPETLVRAGITCDNCK